MHPSDRSSTPRSERPEDEDTQPLFGVRDSGRTGEDETTTRSSAGSAGGTARTRISTAGNAVRRGAGGAARASGAAARATGRGARQAFRLARRASHAEGAGESGLFRLVELHAFNAAGDAAVAIALAGTLFFQVPTGEARGQVALFLLLTMLPFAIVAPLIGPFLDRFRRGRRWAIGSTMAIRGFLCWVLATAVVTDSAVQFPAALGVLVASKAYGVTRASAVPRLIPRDLTLVRTNSRVSLAGVAGATISAPLAGGLSMLGPEWSLRYAFLLFVVGTVLAILLPARVDSSEGEDSVSMGDMAGRPASSRRVRINPEVVTALRSNSGLRALSGFLVMFMAFLLRDQPFEGWDATLLIGVVVGAAGAGSTVGTVLGNLLRSRNPQLIVLVVLVGEAVVAVLAAVFYGLVFAVLLGLTAGLCQQLGKLSLDSIIQDNVPEDVRTSVFARSETVLQLSWVLGGGLGIVMPLDPHLGLGVAAGLLVVWLLVILRGRANSRRRTRASQPV